MQLKDRGEVENERIVGKGKEENVDDESNDGHEERSKGKEKEGGKVNEVEIEWPEEGKEREKGENELSKEKVNGEKAVAEREIKPTKQEIEIETGEESENEEEEEVKEDVGVRGKRVGREKKTTNGGVTRDVDGDIENGSSGVEEDGGEDESRHELDRYRLLPLPPITLIAKKCMFPPFPPSFLFFHFYFLFPPSPSSSLFLSLFSLALSPVLSLSSHLPLTFSHSLTTQPRYTQRKKRSIEKSSLASFLRCRSGTERRGSTFSGEKRT